MKRLFHILLLVVGLGVYSEPLLARGMLSGWAEQGGHNVNTGFFRSSTEVQQSYPGATVTVYLAGTNTKATIYGDNVPTLKPNPFAADAFGYWFFLANDGLYDVTISDCTPISCGITTPFTFSSLQISTASPANGGEFSVLTYGATCNGTADDTTAIQSAVNAASAAGGGIVQIPNSTCTYTSLSFNNTHGVWFRGYNQMKATVVEGSAMKCTAVGAGSCVTAVSAVGLQVSNIYWYDNPSFTGTLLNWDGLVNSGTGPANLHDCNIGTTTDTATTLLSLNNSLLANIKHNMFQGGQVQVAGNGQGITLHDRNQFSGYTVAAIQDPRQGWSIDDNDFEPGTLPLAGTVSVTNNNTAVNGLGTTFTANVGSTITINFVTVSVASVNSDTSITLSSPWAGTTASGLSATVPFQKCIKDTLHSAFGVAFTRNWIGDSTASNIDGFIELGGGGYNITGNFIGATGGTGNVAFKAVGNVLGANIAGNSFGSLPEQVFDFGATAGGGPQLSSGVIIAGNYIGGWLSVSSITSVGTTATVTTANNHNMVTGTTNYVTITGASPSVYNGRYAITVTGAKTFTYTFLGGSSPATGTIHALAPFINITTANSNLNTYQFGPNYWLNAVTADFSKLFSAVTNIGQYGATVYKSAAQSIANDGARHDLTWDQEAADQGSVHNTTTNPELITVPGDGGGVWQVCVYVSWDANTSTTTSLDIYKNSTRQVYALQAGVNSGGITQRTCVITTASAGDTFKAGATVVGGAGAVNARGLLIDTSHFSAWKLY